MTILSILLSVTSFLLFSIIIFLIWYIKEALSQIRASEQYTFDLISGIEELKEVMETYIKHVDGVHEMEMFYGDETLRDLIRHGKALIETFEDYKVDYFPILEMKEIMYDDDEKYSYRIQEEN
jgi:cell division protein FtsX